MATALVKTIVLLPYLAPQTIGYVHIVVDTLCSVIMRNLLRCGMIRSKSCSKALSRHYPGYSDLSAGNEAGLEAYDVLTRSYCLHTTAKIHRGRAEQHSEHLVMVHDGKKRGCRIGWLVFGVPRVWARSDKYNAPQT
ncbi:hypothetical protein BS17DRAFT_769747 [Gyrodon lividus]|nr:hypothetical protein BS17DRAFT_769747 [Gyrodon lividus]